jgi:hypothetical protein
VKRLLKAFMAASGCRIVRNAPGKCSSSTVRHHVEMIGPPGAGKTTTINLPGKSVLKNWRTLEDLNLVPFSRRSADYGSIHKTLLLKRLEPSSARSSARRRAAEEEVYSLEHLVPLDLPDPVLLDSVHERAALCKGVAERAQAHGMRVIELAVEDGAVQNIKSLQRVLAQLCAAADFSGSIHRTPAPLRV